MDLLDHPGNLGAVRGTLLTVHHADWPAYPQGEDFRATLLQLTAFPVDTAFKAMDHIDRSALLIACVRGARVQDPFSTNNFHIAAWYNDLIELDKRGFIEGIVRVSERQWHEAFWRKLLSEIPAGAQLGYTGSDGIYRRLDPPDFESYSNDPEYYEFVLCRDDKVTVTGEGRTFVQQELGELKAGIVASVGDRVCELFERAYYDTCIREACVQLEHEIRGQTRSDAFGDKLVELFVETIRSEKRHLESHIRTVRQELRALFKFIRNEFMHNLLDADRAATLAILFRVARLRNLLQERR